MREDLEMSETTLLPCPFCEGEARVEPDALYNVLREKPRKRMDPATKISLWITGVIAVILMYWIFS
jgi:hypothetical protein